jgi:WD40 repeat protein
MPNTVPISVLEKFTSFGDLLRFLRRRVGITQLEFAVAVGYSDSQISKLEQNMRLPDPLMIEARFVPALFLEDEPNAVRRLLELAAKLRLADAPALGRCPYKGLDYFDEMDADLFVGREVWSEKISRRIIDLVLRNELNQYRLLTVIGSSGSGKSSLVRAGVIPAIRKNKSCASWPIQVLTPTTHPLESLAIALAGGASLAEAASLTDDLSRDSRTLGLYVKHKLLKSDKSQLLLIVDQFEEVFALCRSETERSSFIDNLTTAATSEDGHTTVIICLRADFYTHCASYPKLREALSSQQEYIGAMNEEEIRRVIEEPAQRSKWDLEPGLVELILQDVGHEPGALPLLSHALLETWQRRHGHTMTLSGYASAGGVGGAIAETAEAVFTDRFNQEQQAISRRIFLRLTQLGDETGSGDTRRRVTVAELIPKPEEAEPTRAVLSALADVRLITTSADFVEVAHEALIREWPRLRAWLDENREGLHMHRQLTQATQDWLNTQCEPDMLYRGIRLARVQEWASAHADDLNAQEQEFLTASLTCSKNEAAEREAQHLRELEAAKKLADTERQRAEDSAQYTSRIRRRSFMISGIGIVAIILAVFAIIAWRSSTSQTARLRSISLASAAQIANQRGQGDLAIALAMESVNINQPPIEALNALREVGSTPGTRMVLTGHSHEVRAAALSPDAKAAFSGSCAQLDSDGECELGELILWDASSGKEQKRWYAHSTWVTAVEFSSDGQTLISGGEDGTLLLWDRNGNYIGQLLGHRDSITDLDAVANSIHLLSGSGDGYLIMWDLKTGNVVQRFAATENPIVSISIAAIPSLAISANQSGSLLLWDLGNHQPVRYIPHLGYDIKSIVLDPTGNWILIISNDTLGYYLRMIRTTDGLLLHQHLFSCVPGDLDVSPDSSFILITCSSTIIKMDLQDWSIQNTFYGHDEIFNTISISQDGQTALSTSKDGSLRVWDLSENFTYRTQSINVDSLNAIDISADGNYLLLSDAEKDDYIRPVLWDVTQKKVITTCDSSFISFSPGGVKISPDRHYAAAVGIITGYYNFKIITATVWDLETGKIHFTIPLFLANSGAVAISPDSRYLLIGTQLQDKSSGQFILYDIETTESVLEFDTPEDISSIAFNSDGTRAITGSRFLGGVILWDIKTGTEIRNYSYAENGPIFSVAFGPGDTTVLGAGLGEIYLWDTDTGELLDSYAGLTSTPWSLAISPQGNYVLAGTEKGELILWDFATGEALYRENLPIGIYSVVFSPKGNIAYAAAIEGKLIELQSEEKSPAEPLEWIKANRYIRELSCAEKKQYHVPDQMCNP